MTCFTGAGTALQTSDSNILGESHDTVRRPCAGAGVRRAAPNISGDYEDKQRTKSDTTNTSSNRTGSLCAAHCWRAGVCLSQVLATYGQAQTRERRQGQTTAHRPHCNREAQTMSENFKDTKGNWFLKALTEPEQSLPAREPHKSETEETRQIQPSVTAGNTGGWGNGECQEFDTPEYRAQFSMRGTDGASVESAGSDNHPLNDRTHWRKR